MKKREIIRKLQQNEIEPESIGKLANLEWLDLRDTKIEELPESIGELTNLKILDLNRANIEELPESIGKLTNLENLYLSNTNIGELPESIGKLTNLEVLDLSGTKIEELPESIGKLTNLEVLDLSGTKIEELPESIGELTNLENLYLSNTNIGELPESIGKLTNLKYLDLSGTNIEELPKSIGELTNLENLYLSNTNIGELPESIGKLTNLEVLYLSGTNIEELPESIGKLTNLEVLYLSGTKIEKLSEGIGKSTNLQVLDLSGTKIEKLSEGIGKSTNLQVLDLSRTKLKKLPYSLFQLDLEYKFEKYFSENGINLYQTQLTQMPISLFMQDRSLIEAYYEEERRLINESKVILLGDGGAGKTYLVDRIFNDGEKLPRTHEPDTTTGILIRDYPMEMENGSLMSVRFWDFGGQQIMHSMHRCFLTSRSLYVVLLDARNDTQDFQAYYWLNNIKSFAPDAPVILVINKMDQNPTASVNQRELTRKYPNLKEVIRISALKDEKAEFDHFLYKLKQQLTILDGYGMEFPISWFQIMKTLEEKHQEEVYYIEQDDYEDICIENGVKDSEIRQWLLEWFNDLGVCFSFHKGNDSLSLSPYKVLDPKWQKTEWLCIQRQKISL